jgi:peptidoglycan/LPS O-acetylase OafA/YrhL
MLRPFLYRDLLPCLWSIQAGGDKALAVTSEGRGKRVRPAWLTAAGMYLALLFLFLPVMLAVGSWTAVWVYYVLGLIASVGIGLFTARWYRTTLLESGPYHRVLRIDAVRAARRATGERMAPETERT